ncbi:calcium/sodium antiporter [Tabrizicola piscis]|uniref:Calcium/sodium antiporter n=1 Tax=Tabrizicola piscis TaxID=2494374 RepID=A0A3S8U1S1_9RHOB|nr:calcium/sodium antiporter [Tabrizicola piscis]AZL57553.1 calcium/sodium antiporter [Tabrizicola piscis]
MTYLLFTLGLAMLFFGGEALVRGASAVARHFHLSPMVIGLTIVGFGTSAPELLVSLQAAWEGKPEIAIGNVVGSNIANILLILGISALIAPLVIPARRMWRDLAFMLAATAILWAMLLGTEITRTYGAILFAGLLVFLGSTFFFGKIDPEPNQPEENQLKAWAYTIGGLVILVIGARFLVNSAVEIATAFGISQAVIGLTIVAVGTSLPELATSVIAAYRKQTEIAVGNIVGSNVFNIFGILGITALVAPIPADPRFAAIDMPVAAAVAVGLTVLAFLLNGLPRVAGALLLVAYGGYIYFMA